MSKKNKNIDINILPLDEISKIEDMLKKFKKDKNKELEVSFNALDYTNYMRINEYYVNLVNVEDISAQKSLDISIILSDGTNYRITLNDADQINDFLNKYSNKNLDQIQGYLLELNPSDKVEIIYKDRGSADKFYNSDLNLVFKITEEKKLDKSSEKPQLRGIEKMVYRYKDRYSFHLNSNVRIDITDVHQTPSLLNLFNNVSKYEMEMEIINHQIDLNTFMQELISVLKVVQDTWIPIGKEESKYVISQYNQLLNISSSKYLNARNVLSLETTHVIQFIPNKYAITDKADGERYFLLSIGEGVYLISINLNVKKTSIKVPDQTNLILDGELIKLDEGQLFMAFDVVYAAGIDYRTNTKYTLNQRIIVLHDIIDKIFGNLVPFTNYADQNSDLEYDQIKQFYVKEVKKYWKLFNERFKKSKDIFITRKIYFVPYGIESAEVFMYADLVWKLSKYGNVTPYKLDGIIYTPINSPYMIKSGMDELDSVPLEYKWKPPSQNSIDFYIEFDKNTDQSDAIYYDNTVVRAEGNAYKVARLYVGVFRSDQEKPTQFKINNVPQTANIYLNNGEAVDIDDRVINDKTVVEFVFDSNKAGINDSYKWIPIRTRYDKTESVNKYRKKYGNHLSIALRIWRSIVNPITEEDIATLSNPLSYQKEMNRLIKSSDTYQKKSFVYYQKVTENASGMRAFNNWIKSNLILTYSKYKHNALDIGCGRGGDLRKFIHADIKEYVGIDIDYNGLYVINDSAINRYKTLKKQLKNIPPMEFIQADAKALFKLDAQENAIPHMNATNKELINKFLIDKKYDVINNQFSIHYYLSDKISWTNYCTNIKNKINDNGFLLITTFDGKLLYDKLKNKQNLEISYINNSGKKNIFFEIIKTYNDEDTRNLGMGIDIYNSLISNPGTYNREYLVFPEYLIKSMKKIGLELVESESFFNLFNLYRNYFLQNDNEKFLLESTSDKQYQDIRKFYQSLKPNAHSDVNADAAMASFKLAMLNRYYVFKKVGKSTASEPSRIIGINHQIDLGKIIIPFLHKNKMIINPSKKTNNVNSIYRGLIKRYAPVKPSVYLIGHDISEDKLKREIFRRNKYSFDKIIDGNESDFILIYRSPEKYFYPIYYQNIKHNDLDPLESDQLFKKIKGTYLLNSNEMVDNLNKMVALTEAFNKNNG